MKGQGSGENVHYKEVFFSHIFYFYWDEKYRSLFRGLHYIGLLYRSSTLQWPTPI